MSSSTYVADLHPDARLRQLVLLSGTGLSGVGALLIFGLPWHIAATTAGACLWLAFCARELMILRRSFISCRRFRVMADGAVLLLGEDGDWRAAELAPGSIVLRRLAWIRCRTDRGDCFSELVSGSCRKSDDWRRMQVIWRHIGGAL